MTAKDSSFRLMATPISWTVGGKARCRQQAIADQMLIISERIWTRVFYQPRDQPDIKGPVS